MKSVWANDIDENSCRTYARNIHNGDNGLVVCSPVEKVNFENPLGDLILKHKIGETVKIKIWRYGKEEVVFATLEERP